MLFDYLHAWGREGYVNTNMAMPCAASSSRDLYRGSSSIGMCMPTFLEYVLYSDSRSPEQIVPVAWISAVMVCIVIALLHWEAYNTLRSEVGMSAGDLNPDGYANVPFGPNKGSKANASQRWGI